MMLRYLFLILLLFCFAAACSSGTEETTESQIAATEEGQEGEREDEEEHEDEGERREHDAHEHGAAELTIAWSGSEIAMDLETPAFNILGFEYAPSTTAEQELLDESLATLQEGGLLRILSPDAECTLTDAVVNTTLGEEEPDEDEEHEEEAGETHSDIDVAYTFQCQNPEQIEMVDAGELFAQFPNFEELEVQWISDTQQSAGELTPDNSILVLE